MGQAMLISWEVDDGKGGRVIAGLEISGIKKVEQG
jgi:hypothetical protein